MNLSIDNPPSQPDVDELYLSTTYHNANTLWCRALVQAAITTGMKTVVSICGGRSTALISILSTQPGVDVEVYNDERAAAFYALGLAKVTGKPVGISTTSGSAVANLVPALVEAKACGIPLILLTTDRPRSVRDTGAPQCADHMGICKSLVCAAIDLDDPQDSFESLKSMQKDVLNTLSKGLPRGPVHINVPMLGAITSMDQDPNWKVPDFSIDSLKINATEKQNLEPTPATLDLKARLKHLQLKPNMKGLIVVGPDSPVAIASIISLAEKLNYPVIADAPTGLRRPSKLDNLISDADLMVVSPSAFSLQPEVSIRFGEAPIANMVQRYLQNQACPTICFSKGSRTSDYLNRNAVMLDRLHEADIDDLISLLGSGDEQWLKSWLSLSQQVALARETYLLNLGWSESKAASIVSNAQGFELFHVANSLSIRHVNLHLKPASSAQAVTVNRGASGIDGTISTFLGELSAFKGNGLLLLGDLAAGHDIAALHNVSQSRNGGAICIMNNNGGGIFDLLSCNEMHDYQRLVRNPLNMNFEKVSKGFDVPYIKCCSQAELLAALSDAAENQRLCLIEVVVPDDSAKSDLSKLFGLIMNGVY
ncbi:2-succinyl-5-enolpyruvyl-6-hydroxy-3-cyclohexene-1-carboxylic-acid synthase [Arenicella sp. 4NH20-0111]|uniref:2-succinyl-5-enolpyruvyl-6-hydroxy-3- cyclohexene-1-carboxylic-acid synthase n=1 Tax=Arenicella sp. 4NH20-0111 TaxID=3127648 RepID=UPI003105C656